VKEIENIDFQKNDIGRPLVCIAVVVRVKGALNSNFLNLIINREKLWF